MEQIINPSFQDPADLTEIYEFGNLVENVIFQPHLANNGHKDMPLAVAMKNTYFKDPLCRGLLHAFDFRRQHEWYRAQTEYGIPMRCKADGDSKALSLILEFKGLAVDSQKAFDAAVDRFHYDQGIAFYLDTAQYKRLLLVAVSKKFPGKIFKELVDRDHRYYKRGKEKVIKKVKLFRETLAI